MQLYSIANDLMKIMDTEDGEIDAEALEAVELAMEQKVEGILKYRQGLVSDAAAIEDEIQRLRAKQDGIKRKAAWLCSYVLSSLQRTGVGRISTLTFNASVSKSPPKAELVDPNCIPEAYKKVKTEISLDKAKVIEDWKAGKELPVELQVTVGTHLRIT